MAPAANETSLKVNAILQSPSDWLLWHQEFRGYIIRAQLDEYFDGKRELRTQPEYFSTMKEIREFKEKEYSQAYLTEARRRNVAIPDGVTSHFEDVVSHEDHGPIYDLATKKANEEYEAIKDGLLIDGKNRYDALVRAYNREDKEVKFIHNWLNSSVAEHYRMAYFLPDHSYRQWYQDLKGIAIEPRTRLMMHDRGMAGSSMSRADIYGPAPGGRSPSGLHLAQGGGGGGAGGGGGGSMGEQSGGLQGSTPGSPGTGTLGSTPQSTLGLSQQPAQGAAVPLAPNQGGRAAPVPGTGVQAPGGTGQMPGDNQRGAPTTGIR